MIQLICFSRKRPLQLHGYLTSVFKYWWGDFRVAVLWKGDAGYEQAYIDLAREFPDVTFWGQEDFRADLDALIGDAEFTCFGCDDVVYVAPVHTNGRAVQALGPDVLGMSLRLGQNTTENMFGGPMPRPEIHVPTFSWDLTEGVVDWGYPWEVLGTIYRTDFVREMVAAIQPGSPSQLEERGSHIWQQHTTLRRMAAFPLPRLVVPTVNVVQGEYPNGIRGNPRYTPEYLLEQWNRGWRLDVDAYAGMAPPSWRIGEFHLRRVAVPA